METASRFIGLLENTKFSASADLAVLQISIELLFNANKTMLQKGSRPREQFIQMLNGKLALSSAAFTAQSGLEPLVQFLQGLIIYAISLVNGIGRIPFSLASGAEGTLKLKFNNRPQPVVITLGKYDEDMGRLVREFKTYYYGKAQDESLSKNDLLLIKEALQETKRRLKNEKNFIDKLAREPAEVFSNNKGSEFGARLFLVLSALPVSQLNTLLMNIGSYLPEELQEFNEDMFKVGVRGYLCTANQDMHELFKKIRLLLKLYFGKQKEIISIIVREKTKQLFVEMLQNEQVKQEVINNLKNAAENQFALRLKLIDNILALF